MHIADNQGLLAKQATNVCIKYCRPAQEQTSRAYNTRRCPDCENTQKPCTSHWQKEKMRAAANGDHIIEATKINAHSIEGSKNKTQMCITTYGGLTTKPIKSSCMEYRNE